jgi:hypothetical protein
MAKQANKTICIKIKSITIRNLISLSYQFSQLPFVAVVVGLELVLVFFVKRLGMLNPMEKNISNVHIWS